MQAVQAIIVIVAILLFLGLLGLFAAHYIARWCEEWFRYYDYEGPQGYEPTSKPTSNDR